MNVANFVGAGPRARAQSSGGLKKFPSGRESRRFGRRKVFKRATVDCDGGTLIACIVVDISQGGARIQFPNGAPAADVFTLNVEEDDFYIACQVVHRKHTTCGVEFISSPRRLSWARRGNDENLKQALSQQRDEK